MAGSARFDVVSGIPMVPMVPMVTAEAFRQIPPPSKLWLGMVMDALGVPGWVVGKAELITAAAPDHHYLG